MFINCCYFNFLITFFSDQQFCSFFLFFWYLIVRSVQSWKRFEIAQAKYTFPIVLLFWIKCIGCIRLFILYTEKLIVVNSEITANNLYNLIVIFSC